MLLAVDVGNTNTVFSVVEKGEITREWRAQTDTKRTADEHAVWLYNVMDVSGVRRQDIEAAIVSTVVPQGLFHLRTLCRRYFEVEPMVVGEDPLDLGISVEVPDPRQVGADRLVNAVAAYEAYGGDLIVLDFGTATTFDVVGPDGAYRGGVISPGINLSLEALHQAAAKLPRVAIERPNSVIGTGTVSAMQSGVFWGYVGLIEGLVSRIGGEYGRPMTTVATGGLAHWFAGATDAIDHVDRDLTIRGLVLIHDRNVDRLVGNTTRQRA